MNLKCQICGSLSIQTIYYGKIRHGKFGSFTPDKKKILRCDECGVIQLHGQIIDYKSNEYRNLVDGSSSPEHYYRVFDADQAEKITVLGSGSIRGKTIADVGCGAGVFLDFVKGISKTTVAIEPAIFYHNTLAAKGHHVYSYSTDALHDWDKGLDIITSFAVIEHLNNPRLFLSELKHLLSSDGYILLATPNSNDWLIEMMPETYGSFFYRSVHLFYFNLKSISYLAQLCGLKVVKHKFVQQYGVENAMLWLRDKKPTGHGKSEMFSGLDPAYKYQCEKEGVSNFIYAWLEKV